MRFLFACGGTGGHINPAIAVARCVKEKRPDAEILFVGVEGGMETRLVPDAGFEIKTIQTSSFARGGLKSIKKNAKLAKKLISAERAVKRILKEFNPDVVLGTGGYACFPVLSAAAKMKTPMLIHESNAYPGLATRMLAKRSDCVLLNFEATAQKLPKKTRCVVCGNPVRGDILSYDREKARRELGLDERPLLVSFWGSLGARDMNEAIVGFIKKENDNGREFFHIHATGKYGMEWMPRKISESGIELSENKCIELREYINDMPRVLAASDLVMCRGGASTLSEISARAKPAIIVPSPNVTDNHQYKNALELQKTGGAVLIEEKNATPEKLYETARMLLFNKEKLCEMSKNLAKTSVLDATERIYEEMIKSARSARN